MNLKMQTINIQMWNQCLHFMDLFARTHCFRDDIVLSNTILQFCFSLWPHTELLKMELYFTYGLENCNIVIHESSVSCLIEDLITGGKEGNCVGGYMKDTVYDQFNKVQNHNTKAVGAEAKTWEVKVYLSLGKHTVYMPKMMLLK